MHPTINDIVTAYHECTAEVSAARRCRISLAIAGLCTEVASITLNPSVLCKRTKLLKNYTSGVCTNQTGTDHMHAELIHQLDDVAVWHGTYCWNEARTRTHMSVLPIECHAVTSLYGTGRLAVDGR